MLLEHHYEQLNLLIIIIVYSSYYCLQIKNCINFISFLRSSTTKTIFIKRQWFHVFMNMLLCFMLLY